MIDIETDRLMLRLVPLAGLAATAAKDEEACHRLIGRNLPADWFENAWVFEMRLNQWKADPDYAPWSIRAIILKETGDVAGSINCHDKPKAFEHEGEAGPMIEMGYTIFEPFRRQGIASEAILALAGIARTKGVRFLRLSISPENEASQALAKKLGAEKIGTQIDDIDGLEEVFLARL